MTWERLEALLKSEVRLPDIRSLLWRIWRRALGLVGLPQRSINIAELEQRPEGAAFPGLSVLAPPSDQVLEFDLLLPRRLDVPVYDLIRNNFASHAPFSESEVYWQLTDERLYAEGRRVRISYIPRADFRAASDRARDKGIRLDGISFANAAPPYIVTPRPELMRRWLSAHRLSLGILLALGWLALAIATLFGRLDREIASRQQEVVRLASELRKTAAPVPKSAVESIIAQRQLEPDESRKALHLIEAHLAPTATLASFRWRPGEVTVELANAEAQALADKLRPLLVDLRIAPSELPGSMRLTVSRKGAQP
jgi:hypothetical protein